MCSVIIAILFVVVRLGSLEFIRKGYLVSNSIDTFSYTAELLVSDICLNPSFTGLVILNIVSILVKIGVVDNLLDREAFRWVKDEYLGD